MATVVAVDTPTVAPEGFHVLGRIDDRASPTRTIRYDLVPTRGGIGAVDVLVTVRAAGHDPYELYRIENLIMAAPDLDFDVVRQRLMAEKIGPAFGQITVYTTESDKALAASETLMGGTRFGQVRATDLGEQEQVIFKRVKNVAFIDVLGVRSFIGHAYYLDNPSTSSDIIRVLNDDYKPGSPERPLEHRMLNFWDMPADYP